MSPRTPEEFSWFYTLKGNKGDQGFYYFAKRAVKGLQVATKLGKVLVTGRTTSFLLSRSEYP